MAIINKTENKSKEIHYELDAKDLAILKVLQHHAKMPVAEIAKLAHLSTTPTFDRIKRLEANGIIKKYIALLDNKKISKSLMVICFVSLKEHNKNAGAKFIKKIMELQEVIECFSISGQFDFMLKVVCKDMDSYYDFHVNKLSQAENVGHIESTFVIGTIKENQVEV
jgi:Lrp/AsnC family transcriptional regulator, leucine-responsive regulatory protein